MTLKAGDRAQAELTVQLADTAKALAVEVDDDFPTVFATSRMIALMELAASRLMRPLLKQGELSVGVSVDVRHLGATPVGSRVRATASFRHRFGKHYHFKVEASDAGGMIGEGEHVRAIVDVIRLVDGAARRVAPTLELEVPDFLKAG